MLVNAFFKDDDDEPLKNLQYEMCSFSISAIISEIKNIYLNDTYIVNYWGKNMREKFYRTSSFGHHLIQKTHDIIATIFRYKVKTGDFDIVLPEKNNEEIKSFFGSVNVDTNFLANISIDCLNLSYKWYNYLINTIKELPSYIHLSLVCALLYSIDYLDEKAVDSADDAAYSVKDIHKEIPWMRSEKELYFAEKERNRNNYKTKYVLYDYTKEIEMGYGGTGYYDGCILFYDNYLGIEDHETDRDSWGDVWHRHHTTYYIQSEEYPGIINILSEEYQCINIEETDEIIKKVYSTLQNNTEKDLFLLLISVTKEKAGIMQGGTLIKKICKDKIKYYLEFGQYDDFYPDCDSCNFHRTEIINDK